MKNDMGHNGYIMGLILFLFSFGNIASQNETFDKITIKSPEVSAFEQYGKIEMSPYTGTPNIQIPIYNVKAGDIELPITLNYMANAIKVDQEATWVGLNWFLNAGGVVSFAVPKGANPVSVEDWKILFENMASNLNFSPNADFLLKHVVKFDGSSETSTLPHYGRNLFTGLDLPHEPSKHLYKCITTLHENGAILYTANFMNHNLQFIYHPIEKTMKLVNNVQNYKIQGNESGVALITDPNGIKYYFGEIETYTPAGWGNAGATSYALRPISNLLTKIESPTGQTITLKYKAYGGITPIIQCNEVAFHDFPGTADGKVERSLSTEYSVNNMYISEIETESILVKFNVSDRVDIKGNSKKLDNIQIFDRSSNRQLKRFDFAYGYYVGNTVGGEYLSDYYRYSASYFGEPYDPNDVKYSSDNIYKRLRLDKITEYGIKEDGNIEKGKVYKLEYNSGSLPGKTSAARDHWGNYNEQENGGGTYYHTFLSDLSYLGESNKEGFPSSFINGAQRANNEFNEQVVANGLLSRIYYPTGGSNQFLFEPHEISNFPYTMSSDPEKWKKINSLSTRATNINTVMPDDVISSKFFSIKDEALVKFKIEFIDNTKTGWSEMEGSTAYLFKKNEIRNSNGSITEFYTPFKQWRLANEDVTSLSPNVTSMIKEDQIIIPPGVYELRAILPGNIQQEDPQVPAGQFLGQRDIQLTVQSASDLYNGFKIESTLRTMDSSISGPVPVDELTSKIFVVNENIVFESLPLISRATESLSWENFKDCEIRISKLELIRNPDKTTRNEWITVKSWGVNDLPVSSDLNLTRQKKEIIGLSAGIYRISSKLPLSFLRETPSTSTNGASTISVRLDKYSGITSGYVQAKAVGVRVKEIKTYDGISVKTEKYTYLENGVSTGLMMNPIQYTGKKMMIHGGEVVNAPLAEPYATDAKLIKYWIQSSSNMIPQPGGNIGYSAVKKTYVGSDGSNGGTEVYRYWNKTNYTFEQTPPMSDPRNGNLLEQYIYNNSNQLLSLTTNRYDILDTKAYFVNVMSEDIYNGGDEFVLFHGGNLHANSALIIPGVGEKVFSWGRVLSRIYPSVAYRIALLETIKKEFFGSDSIITNINYAYYNDSLFNKKSDVVSNSFGEQIKTIYKYAPNLPNENYMKQLTVANRISIPIVVEKAKIQKSNEEISLMATKIEYDRYNVGNRLLIQPAKLYLKHEDNPYEEQASILKYDLLGNILHQRDKTGLNTVYLWSYVGQYPIAEIKNATFDEVKTALQWNDNDINTLSGNLIVNESDFLKINSLRQKLPQALVTTYTYKPLVGMLSSTDPQGITTYYEYDGFGRLKETYLLDSNKKKNILQIYNYQITN